MNRQEFLDILRKTLNRELNEGEVEENIRYYNMYISEEISKGKTEEQVLAALGDPRLIAKTILQVDEQRENAGGYYQAEQVYTEEEDGTIHEEKRNLNEESSYGMRTFQIKGWMVAAVLIAVILIIFLLLGVAVAIIWKLLPVLLIIWAVIWVYERLKN